MSHRALEVEAIRAAREAHPEVEAAFHRLDEAATRMQGLRARRSLSADAPASANAGATDDDAPTGALFAATRTIRESIEDAFRGRELTEGSLLLERKRRVRLRLERLDDTLAAGEWDAVTEHVGALKPLVIGLIAEARALPAAPERVDARREPPWLRNAGTVARKELVVTLQGVQGLVLFGIFLLTFGIGLGAAMSAERIAGVAGSVQLVWVNAHSLDVFSAPIAGILLGYSLINEERARGTIHFLAAKPVSRTGIVVGKWLGMAGALAAVVFAAAAIVGGVALAATGALGDVGVVVGYVAAVYLLSLSFATIALVTSAAMDRAAAALAASFGAYVLLGPVWQNAFIVRQLKTVGEASSAASIVMYLASPFTAWWNWTSELLGPRSDATGLPVGEPWHAALVTAVERGALEALPFYATAGFYALVLLAWCAAGVAATAWVMGRRDLA